MQKYIVEVYEDRTYWMNGDGKLHRTDGPAIIYSNGVNLWYQYGKLHRTDGPAVEYTHGVKLWYIDDIRFTKKEFKKRTTKQKEIKFNFFGYNIRIIK